MESEQELDDSKQTIIPGELTQYELVRQMAETASAKYYLCRTTEGSWRILSIGISMADNFAMERIAQVLQHLEKEAGDRESALHSHKIEKVKSRQLKLNMMTRGLNPDAAAAHRIRVIPTLEELQKWGRYCETLMDERQRYDWLFPLLQESFIASLWGKRRVNVLDFSGLEIADLMPLVRIAQQNQRVDLKTSAWIVDRMIKLLVFITESGVTTPMLMDKFLICPERHQLMLLDWSSAIMCDSQYADEEHIDLNISNIGKCGLDLLGAQYDEDGWRYPYPCQENEMTRDDYISFLHCMAILWREMYPFSENNTNVLHETFLDCIDKRLLDDSHPFTTYPI